MDESEQKKNQLTATALRKLDSLHEFKYHRMPAAAVLE